MLQYSVNKCVFIRRLKPSLSRYGSLKLSGREFQDDGPATEKARGPSVLSRHRGTTKNRRVVDWICCHAETSDTGAQRSSNLRLPLLAHSSTFTSNVAEYFSSVKWRYCTSGITTTGTVIITCFALNSIDAISV